MSKMAQRKRDAYEKGFRAGRFDNRGEKGRYSFRVTGGVRKAFDAGFRLGRDERRLSRKPIAMDAKKLAFVYGFVVLVLVLLAAIQ